MFSDRKHSIFFFSSTVRLGPFLIGVAVATFFTGSQFTLNTMNQVTMEHSWYGLEALLNIRNLALGFAVLFLSRINGLLYIMNSISDDDLCERSVRKLLINTFPSCFFFCFLLISLLVSSGFAADP